MLLPHLAIPRRYGCNVGGYTCPFNASMLSLNVLRRASRQRRRARVRIQRNRKQNRARKSAPYINAPKISAGAIFRPLVSVFTGSGCRRRVIIGDAFQLDADGSPTGKSAAASHRTSPGRRDKPGAAALDDRCDRPLFGGNDAKAPTGPVAYARRARASREAAGRMRGSTLRGYASGRVVASDDEGPRREGIERCRSL